MSICNDPSDVKTESKSKKDIIRVTSEPGICGFCCVVEARKTGQYTVSVKIEGSACEHAQRLSCLLEEMSLKDLFAPVTRNLVFVSAQRAACHPSCPIPIAVLKAAEVAMDMALPREVRINFQP